MNAQQNSLALLNYKFKLSRTPDVEYRAQSVSIPGLSLGSIDVPTPFGLRTPFHGNIAYDDLNISFLVGEELGDYLEIHNWMTGLGRPDESFNYPASRDNPTAVTSDITVFILNSAMRPIINVRFTDAYPISLSSLDFDSTLSEVQYAQATATFRYNRFYFDTI
jgi:hypothetical protein